MEIFQTSELRDAIDDIWIVSGQSATQRGLLNSVSYTFLYLKQGNCIRCQSVAFMDIRTRKPYSKDIIIEPSVHEQEDGTILAVAVTGTCSKDSLLSLIRFLEKKNPNLANLSILFTTNSPLGEVIPAIESSVPVNTV
ncbi:hypothetical protein OUZ56_026078 [Daphnia magna]|uniref:ECSIT C-terminal domain-containing protein n=1 Tax=Daphnia magna TaxID=35525 RepID=A0ABQ9ZM34_9CRUS|nr:hypothetical protein OUZ56_026078 [Daphnia magna]